MYAGDACRYLLLPQIFCRVYSHVMSYMKSYLALKTHKTGRVTILAYMHTGRDLAIVISICFQLFLFENDYYFWYLDLTYIIFVHASDQATLHCGRTHKSIILYSPSGLSMFLFYFAIS